MKRHIVFDLDGTLVDSLPGIAEGVNRSLQELGRPVLSLKAISRMIGSGAANLCGKALGYKDAAHTPAEELEAIAKVCVEQDIWPGDAMDSAAFSAQYLKKYIH